ncbi:MAG: FkbM family methyltransferase [Chitinophagaceae bacterium]
MRNLFRKIVTKLLLKHSQLIYSQSGEDLILAQLFFKMDILHPTYLDIGANHPMYISNTYYFYMRGSKGVCIEPNPYLYQKIRKVRPRDTVLNIGIGITSQAAADFYLFPKHAHGLSTFSKEEAEYWQQTGMKKMGKIQYEKVIQVPLQPINTIIKENFTKAPDFVSIDVEGLDLQILQSLDFDLYAPLVLCVETLAYDEDQREHKKEDIIAFVKSKGYSVYADTHINTIFLRN